MRMENKLDSVLSSKENFVQRISSLHNRINEKNGKKTRTPDEQLCHYESNYVENRIILREVSQWSVFWFEIQGVYNEKRRSDLSNQEKIEAIMSCPNNLYQDWELYHFDGVWFKKIEL